MEELKARIEELEQLEELDRLRPELDGHQVMAYLGVEGGPTIGRAMNHLMDIRLDDGLLGTDEIYKRLDEWAQAEGIEVAGEKVAPKKKREEREARD
jgi:poly(A) polymerase